MITSAPCRIRKPNLPLPLVLLLFVLLLPALFPLQAAPSDYRRPEGYVSDFAGVIDAADERIITDTAAALKRAGDIELAVVTVPSLGGYSVEEFSIELAQQWGIGIRGKDTGLLLLVSTGDRQVRIEVGYGLEGDLPDGLVGSILDKHIIPHLRRSDYSRGMADGARALAATLADARKLNLATVNIKAYAVEEESENYIPGILFTLFIIIFVFGGRRRLLPMLLLGHAMSRGSRGGGFGSTGRSGGFGGGGFGGFGGGSFGGGGASRSF